MEAALQPEKERNTNTKTQGKNLTECTHKNMLKSVGGKSGEAKPKRKCQPQTKRSTKGYTQRVLTTAKLTLDTNSFEVKWLEGSRVYK